MKKLTTFILTVTLTSYFDVALNKRQADQESVFCVWLFHAMIQCLCQKTVSETHCYMYLSITTERPTYLSTFTSAQRIAISIFLIMDEYVIMIEMQTLMQEFIFGINVKCLHSNLQ